MQRDIVIFIAIIALLSCTSLGCRNIRTWKHETVTDHVNKTTTSTLAYMEDHSFTLGGSEGESKSLHFITIEGGNIK